ncbi:hypothetical protein PQR08_25245 [Caballeronia jiangsuensis]|uniref:Uncharacterized protein n=1 Tax=Caballeronia jiangsuensis TaxID=1458357 RepID=A0ABW9CSP7_9BURK
MILTPPDGLSFAAYIKKALADELKAADSYGDLQPKVTLSGKVEELESSSTVGLTGSYWNIKLLAAPLSVGRLQNPRNRLKRGSVLNGQ